MLVVMHTGDGEVHGGVIIGTQSVEELGNLTQREGVKHCKCEREGEHCADDRIPA